MRQQHETEPRGQMPHPMPEERPENDDSFIATRDAEDLGTRWNAIQANFVDDPRAAVQEADRLVQDVYERITRGFSQQRDALAHKWGQGQEPSTEELRVALQRYRGFFQRLLST